MSAPLFAVRDLRLERGGRAALDIPALELPDGCVCAITGPNGAGKTTLLLALAQLLPLDQGRVSFLGREVTPAGLPPAQLRRQVTMVMQDSYLLGGSVGKNLAYGLGLRALSRAETASRVQAALAAVGLPGFASRNSRALSGGERQRVALARALALRPRALLLDEPFASLDRAGAAIVEELIIQLPAQGCAVLLVAHDQALVKRLAQHVVCLEEGRLGANPF